jgi:hypothetical protein
MSKYNFLNKANDALNADLTSYTICIKIIFFLLFWRLHLLTMPSFGGIRPVSHEFVQWTFDLRKRMVGHMCINQCRFDI